MFAVQRQAARSRERKSGERSPERAHAYAQPMLAVQRASCACGGGCPRCREKYPLQAQLEVSQPGDTLEQEADRIAEHVLRTPQSELPDNPEARKSPGLRVSRFTSSSSAQSSPEVPPIVHDVVRSPGEPLDPATRGLMEPRFGADFREVRVHTDAEAAASARLMRAQAYTVGRDVVFAAGKFSPATAEGRALLAHELTHVRQDSRSAGGLTSDVVIGSSHDPAEGEAAATAAGALRGETVRPCPRATAAVGGPTVLRRAEATGGTVDSDLETQIDADVQRIIAILDEWHYSNADEQQVIDILTKWALAPPGPGRLTPLDRVFAKLTRRTTTVGVMGQTMSYYSLIFNHFDRAQEVRELRDRHAPVFHGEAGIQEASLLQQDWMETAGEFYGPIKEGFYEALIAGMRGTQAAALNRMRAIIANWPPAAKAVGEVAIGYIEINTDILISLVLAIIGLVVGFVSGIAKLVWGLLQFLWGILDLVMLWILSHFSEARREQLQERAVAIDEGIRQFFPALKTLADQWWAEFQTASPDRQSIMIGELTGEVEAILASFLAGGKVAGALPKLEAAPARVLAVVGGGTLVRGGAITANMAAAGPPLIAGTLVGTTAMAVSEEAKGGGPPEQALKEPPESIAKPKEPAPKEPLPSERKFQPGEWEKLSPKEQKAFVDQYMKEHNITTVGPKEMPKSQSQVTAVRKPTPPEGFEDMPHFESRTSKQAGVSLEEDHHIATRYRKENKAIFEKAGLKIDDDMNLIKDFSEHGQLRGSYDWENRSYKFNMKGHHKDYNEWVTRHLTEATPDGLPPDQALTRITKVTQELSTIIQKYPEVLSHGPKILPPELQHLTFKWD